MSSIDVMFRKACAEVPATHASPIPAPEVGGQRKHTSSSDLSDAALCRQNSEQIGLRAETAPILSGPSHVNSTVSLHPYRGCTTDGKPLNFTILFLLVLETTSCKSKQNHAIPFQRTTNGKHPGLVLSQQNNSTPAQIHQADVVDVPLPS